MRRPSFLCDTQTMASPSEHQQTPESDYHSVSDSNDNTDRTVAQVSQPQGQVIGYPPTMAYPPPPPMGYPHPHPASYHPVYSGYNPHATAPPPPPSKAYSAKPSSKFSATCARSILFGISFFALVMCMISIFTWLVLCPETPKFHLEGLSVSNFNVTGTFTACWDANVTVKNPNKKLCAYFDKIRTAMYYNVDFVSMSAVVDPFKLETDTENTMRVKLATNNTEHSIVETGVIQKMNADWNTGTVIFSLKITIWSVLKAKSWGEKHVIMTVDCDNLGVNFPSGSSNGMLSGGKSIECILS